MKKRLPSIRMDLFKMMSHMFFTFVVLFTGLFGYLMYRYSQDEIYTSSRELAVSIGNYMTQVADEITYSLNTVSEIIEVQQSTFTQGNELMQGVLLKSMNNGNKRLTNLLEAYLKQHEKIKSVRILDASGKVRVILPFEGGELGRDYSAYPFYTDSVRGLIWPNTMISSETGERELYLVSRKEGFSIVLQIDLEEIRDMLKGISTESDIIVYDGQGNVVVCTGEESESGANHAHLSHIEKALNGESVTGMFLYTTGNVDKRMLGSTLPIHNGWVVTVFKPADEVFFPFLIMIVIFICSLGLIYGASAFAIRYFSKTLVKPINSLVRWSDELAGGKYNEELQIESYKEINKLAESFQTMSRSIEEREIILNEQKDALLLSERKAHQANQAKSDFLANMSHEFRTPLNGILGFSQMLDSTELNDEQKAYLNNVIHSSRHLLSLVTDVLDFSKIEAGKLELEKTNTNLRELLDKSYSIVKPAADAKHLTFTMKTASDLPLCVETDPLRLGQVLINLLNNAVKFTDKGEIQLITEVIDKSEGKVSLRFEVSDTGIGIPLEKQETIFEMFTQVDSSITRKYGGTGLGLTISDQILKLMGSAIKLNSESGFGSTFGFDLTLPLIDERHQMTESGKTDVVIAENVMRSEVKILIVEDDLISSKLVSTIIGRNFPNAVVLQAYDGGDAVSKYHEHRPEIVLMDMHLPVKSGPEVVREIRRMSGDHSAYILGLSADARQSSVDGAVDAGFDQYMTKPFEKQMLIDNICRGLERKNLIE
ncbi:MAG TPA: ATP-binding protein [Thermotogota bacterium]|nr:ATP-binding protein [Thermotogota bacterium]